MGGERDGGGRGGEGWGRVVWGLVLDFIRKEINTCMWFEMVDQSIDSAVVWPPK